MPICGVRLTRSGMVRWLDAGQISVGAGDLVVAREGGEDVLATVVVGAGQVVGTEALPIAPSGILRLATGEDERTLGRQAVSSLGASDRLGWLVQERAEGARILDAQISADGAKVRVLLDGMASSPDELALVLTREIGLPVDLEIVEEPAAKARPVSAGRRGGSSGTAGGMAGRARGAPRSH